MIVSGGSISRTQFPADEKVDHVGHTEGLLRTLTLLQLELTQSRSQTLPEKQKEGLVL